MRIFAQTDIGKTREMNQDCYYVSSTDDEPLIFILADGMGGYTGGEIASSMVIEYTKSYINGNWIKISKTEEDILQLLIDAVQYANKFIYEKSKTIEELSQMGTTLEICLIFNNKLYIAHIGDSRIYIINENNIKQITTDHTYIEKLIKEGTITKEEAKHHPDRHMLLKALGGEPYAEVDAFSRTWKEDEIICICSDGLTNMINDEQIKEIIIEEPVSPEKKLINMANDNGGTDNITVIIIKH